MNQDCPEPDSLASSSQVGSVAGSRIRRGLVISGGGAKGAYSFGALKALRECGIEFEAVSGTSAGALNAAIWSTGEISVGESLWRQMAPENTYKLFGLLRLLPRPASQVIIMIVISFSLMANLVVRGTIVAKLRKITAGGVAFLTWSIGTLLFIISPMHDFFSFSYGMLLLSSYFIFSGLCGDNRHAQFYAICTFFCSLNLLLLADFGFDIGAVVSFSQDSSQNLRSDKSIFPGLALLLLTVLEVILFWIPLDCVMRLSTLTSIPLRKTIATFLNEKTMSIPFFATLAWSKRIYDPDNTDWVNTAPAEVSDQWEPLARSTWIPEYVRVDELSTDTRVDVLVATAALPFGIVEPVVFNGREYVDGGLADNEPIAPMLQYSFDEIWLLSLVPNEKSENKRHEECLDLLRRPMLINYNFPDEIRYKPPDNTKNVPPRVIPYPSIPKWPKLIYLAPAENLGGLLGGLLNFKPGYAIRLIEMGYRDTLDFIKTLPQ